MPVALAWMGGILLHDREHVGAWVLAALAAGLLILGLLLERLPRVATLMLICATFACGLLAARVAAFHFRADDIGLFSTEERRLAQLELFLRYEPRILTQQFGPGLPLPPRQVTVGEVKRIKTWDGWEPASGDILVQIAEPHPRLACGHTVRVVGMLERPAPSMNPGQFDWDTYYRRQRVLASVQIPSAGNITILGDPSVPLLARWRQQTRRLLGMGFDASMSLEHALLRALLLGDKDPELRDVQEQFRRTGTSHHLAISGMHVAIVGGLVFLVGRLCRVSPRASCIAALLVVVVYGATAMPSPPVIRSVVLCAVVGAGVALRRQVDMFQMLAVSLLAMLIWQPLDLFDAGFQLSFGTVLGLMIFTDPLTRNLAGGRANDSNGAQLAQPPGAWAAAGRWADDRLLKSMAAGVVAWLVSMPLIAFHFSQLNPWAVPGSLLLAPVVLLALVAGLLKVLMTALLPGGAEFWALLAAQPISWMRGIVDSLDWLPGAEVPLPRPAYWLMAAFYASLLGLTWRVPHPGIRWFARAVAMAGVLALLVLPYHTGVARREALPDGLRVTVLHVGAGQCVVVETSSGRTFLIDAGSISLADPLRKVIAPYLRWRGITRIDGIFVSHANLDHHSAVGELLQAYDVREVMVAETFEQDLAMFGTGDSLLRTLEANDCPLRILAPGNLIPLSRSARITVLWPPPGFKGSSNDSSLVLRLDCHSARILFPGDIQEAAMRKLLENEEQLRADVVLAPHHGSAEAATGRFLQAVGAQYVVASNDRSLTGKQRQLERLVPPERLYRTHRHGAVTIIVPENGPVQLRPYLQGP